MSPANLFARPAPLRAWLGPPQGAVLDDLLEQARLKVLSGPSSSGKSVLLAHVCARLAEQCIVLRCPGPQADARAVLSTLLRDAELEPWTLQETDQRNLLAVFIQQRRHEGRRVVIVLDQAEQLAPQAWEEIDRLRLYALEGTPAVEMVLAANPQTLPAAGRQHLMGWKGLRGVRLEPPSQGDVASYIEWRFNRHGLPNPFRPVAMRLIARRCGGRYGAVDMLCRMSLMLMRQRGMEQADARLVHDAVDAFIERRRARVRPEDAVPAIAAASRG